VAPAAPGQTDHIMVMFQMGVVAIGAGSEDAGQVTKTGSITGYISVTQE
jgi:hypothetical protein